MWLKIFLDDYMQSKRFIMSFDTLDSSDVLEAALAKVEMIIASDSFDTENVVENKRYISGKK